MALDRINRDFRYSVVLWLSIVGCLSITPLALLRVVAQDWMSAGVDAALVLLILACMAALRKGVDPEKIGMAGAMLTSAGAAITSALDLDRGLMWIHVVIVANFLLAHHRFALLVSVAMIASVASRPGEFASSLDYAGFLTTALSVSVFAAIFAWRTELLGKKLEALAMEDPLTMLGNRRALMQRLDSIVAHTREGSANAMLLMDLDRFKDVNDSWGHEVGDELLKQFAALVRRNSRSGDELYRLGGEEFVLVLPRTAREGARVHAMHLREIVRSELRAGKEPVTVSIGVAEHERDENAGQWLSRTDLLMYRAKRLGRDRVVVEADALPEVAGS